MKDCTKIQEIRILNVSYGCEPSLMLTLEHKLTALVNRVMRLHVQYRTGISRLCECYLLIRDIRERGLRLREEL